METGTNERTSRQRERRDLTLDDIKAENLVDVRLLILDLRLRVDRLTYELGRSTSEVQTNDLRIQVLESQVTRLQNALFGDGNA
jgi:hypothetical protein